MTSFFKHAAALVGGFCIALLPAGAFAQVCHNLYPSPEMATYDNNGNDLRTFILNNKADFLAKGAEVWKHSGGNWGYFQVRVVSVPSIDNVNKDNAHRLNYSESINVTLAMYKTKESGQAAWWARQCNNPKGPLIDMLVDAHGSLDMDYVRYPNIMDDAIVKPFSIVEYSGDLYNPKDYNDMLKSYIMIANGTIPELGDYDTIIDYYNNFLSKFSDITDPLLEYKSFLTFFKGAHTNYVGRFNVVNGKLAGKLETVTISYNRDKDAIVAANFKKLTGSVVYVYGDTEFGMDKAIDTYAREHHIKVIRRSTTTGKNFNKDISLHEPRRNN